MNGHGDFNPELAQYYVIGTTGGDVFDFGPKKNSSMYGVSVFDSIHAVPCVSYGFYQKKRHRKLFYHS